MIHFSGTTYRKGLENSCFDIQEPAILQTRQLLQNNDLEEKSNVYFGLSRPDFKLFR